MSVLHESGTFRPTGWVKLAPLCIALAWVADTSEAESSLNVVGLSQIEAQEIAANYGVDLEVTMVDSTKRRGLVLSQVPVQFLAAGLKQKLLVTVSDGLPVPDVLGLSEATATSLLAKLGIAWERVDRQHFGFSVGMVGGQLPEPRIRIDPSRQVVFLSVSNDGGVQVPDLSGLSFDAASAALVGIGLSHEPKSVGIHYLIAPCTRYDYPDEYPMEYLKDITSTVFATVPSYPTYVAHGSVIELRTTYELGETYGMAC